MAQRHQKGSLSAKHEAKRGRGASPMAALPERAPNEKELLAESIRAHIRRRGLSPADSARAAGEPPARMMLLAGGKLYSFTTARVGPHSFDLSPDDLRGWRMTVLSGKQFGHVFRVSGNTESVVTVKNDKGGLDGLQVHDVFVIESIDENGMSMFAPPGTAQPVPPGL